MSQIDDTRAAIAAELGLADGAALAALADADAIALRDGVRALVAQQRAALAAAIDAALEQVPWVLRGAVRKVLFP
jgi:hypothetical protein